MLPSMCNPSGRLLTGIGLPQEEEGTHPGLVRRALDVDEGSLSSGGTPVVWLR